MEDFSVKDTTAGGPGDPILNAEDYGAECCSERRDAAESRRRILGAAESLFSERGVERVSMYEIGQAAGVGQGTLYRRYENKGALCMALLHESIERFAEEVQNRLEDSGEPVPKQLEYLLARLARFNDENASLLGAIRDAGSARRFGMYKNPFYRWLRETVTVLLERGVNTGEISNDLDIGHLSDAILAPLNIDLYLFQRRELGMDPEHITQSLSRLLFDGLRGIRSGRNEP